MSSESNSSYKLKGITFFGRKVPVVVQNENGPCPLLAIANILLLRNVISLPLGLEDVSQVCEKSRMPVVLCFASSRVLRVSQKHAAHVPSLPGEGAPCFLPWTIFRVLL